VDTIDSQADNSTGTGDPGEGDDLPSSSEGRGPGRPPGGGDSREAILEAAADAFLRDGMNASTRDIAAKAGVTQSALYHYFPTKQDLLRNAAKLASRFFEHIGSMAVPEGEPEEVFQRLAKSYLRIFARRGAPRFLVTMMVEGMKMPGFMPEMAQRLHGGAVAPTIAYLETLQAEGRISPDLNPSMLGQMLFGTCFSYVIARDVLKAPWVQNIDPDEVARQVAYVLAHGMGGSAVCESRSASTGGTDSETGADPASDPTPTSDIHQTKGDNDEVA
jgi:AcrR family transcriptional regulator